MAVSVLAKLMNSMVVGLMSEQMHGTGEIAEESGRGRKISMCASVTNILN
jgi:hypothetical protein